MAEFHSGLEAYCKTLAKLCGMESNSGSWRITAADVMGPMYKTDDVSNSRVSRLWTLSTDMGKGRPSIFYENWTGRKLDGRPYDLDRCKEAMGACVRWVMTAKDEDGNPSAVVAFVRSYADRPVVLSEMLSTLVDAVCQGLLPERYDPDLIALFGRNMHAFVDDHNFRNDADMLDFILRVFSCVIWGPSHPFANSFELCETMDYEDYGRPEEVVPDQLVLTQVFDDRDSQLGSSVSCSKGQVVCLGRSADVAAYKGKCHQVDLDLEKLFDARAKVIFPVPGSHESTSGAHGVVYYDDEMELWYYRDLNSHNGTSFQARKGLAEARLLSIHPGDKLFLGAPPEATLDSRYRSAMAIRVSTPDL